MKKKEDGGLAFPFEKTEREYFTGMSLRDYFAGQALTNLAGQRLSTTKNKTDFPDIAEQCYLYADAMIKERNK